MPNTGKYKWPFQGKGSQIQISNKTTIEFGSRRIWGIITQTSIYDNLLLLIKNDSKVLIG